MSWIWYSQLCDLKKHCFKRYVKYYLFGRINKNDKTKHNLLIFRGSYRTRIGFIIKGGMQMSFFFFTMRDLEGCRERQRKATIFNILSGGWGSGDKVGRPRTRKLEFDPRLPHTACWSVLGQDTEYWTHKSPPMAVPTVCEWCITETGLHIDALCNGWKSKLSCKVLWVVVKIRKVSISIQTIYTIWSKL